METKLWAIGLVILGTLVGAFAALLFKQGSKKVSFNIKSFIKNKKLMLGFLFYGISTLIFIPALRGGELSVLYPLVATSYIWVSLLSIRFLKEKMNLWKWLGITFILLGVTFVSLN